MDSEFQHLLSKHRILVSFNIAKKVKKTQINQIRKSLEKKGFSKEELEKELNREILSRTKKYINANDIPGLILNNEDNQIRIDPFFQKKIIKISNMISKLCESNNFSKEHVIILVQAIFHLLKITNSDVAKFKEKYNLDSDDDDNYLDDDDDDF